MGDFCMPSLGADMEAGTVVEWKVRPGDVVRRGDVVVLVETDKGLVEVETFEAGVVEALLVEPGTKVPCGTPLARLREAAAPTATPSAAGEAAPPAPARPGGVHASPAARQLAAELGIDLRTVRGSGPDGAVTRADVLATATPPTPVAPTPPPAPVADRSAAMRRAIAAAMARSKRDIPHYYLGTTTDLRHALAWLTDENARRPVTARLLPGALFVRAVALAVREVPEMNGFWRDDHFEPAGQVHVGVAIALRQGGLVAPAIHDADRKGLDEIMAALLDLVKRVRAGSVRSSELVDATITVTSLGDQGVETVYGVIYPPQVALVGFGRVVERPCAVDGAIAVRPTLTVTLAADHRASDGHRGARFLAAIDRRLQTPEAL